MLLSFPKWTFHQFLLVGVPSLLFLSTIIRKNLNGINDFKLQPMLLLLCMTIGESFGLLFELISIYRQKSYNNQRIDTNESTTVDTMTAVVSTINYKKFIFDYIVVFILSFADIASTILGFFILNFSNSKFREIELRFILILVTAFLCCLFFSTPLYKHQLFSIIMIIIGDFCIYFYDESLELFDLFYLLTYFLSLFVFLERWMLYNRSMSPFLLLGMKGIFGIIIVLCFNAIRAKVPCDNKFCVYVQPLSAGFIGGSLINYIYYPVLTVYLIFLNIGYILILFAYTPNYFINTITLYLVLLVLTELAIQREQITYFIILPIVGNILIMIGCIVCNEIVIIHWCGLEYYTKEEINKRSLKENINNDCSIDLIIFRDSL